MAAPSEIPSDLALEVDQDLPPEQFIAAARNFFGYVREVAKASGDEAANVQWTVKAKEGSTILAMDPTALSDANALERLYGRIGNTIKTLAEGIMEAETVGEAALNYIKNLSNMAAPRRDRPIKLNIWVQKKPLAITTQIAETIQEDWRSDYHDFGSIEGKLEAIQDRGRLQLRVRDPLLRATVNCFLPDEMLDEALHSFRHRVEITGVIHYRKNGTPISIEAARIKPLPNDSKLPSANDVRGILATA